MSTFAQSGIESQRMTSPPLPPGLGQQQSYGQQQPFQQSYGQQQPFQQQPFQQQPFQQQPQFGQQQSQSGQHQGLRQQQPFQQLQQLGQQQPFQSLLQQLGQQPQQQQGMQQGMQQQQGTQQQQLRPPVITPGAVPAGLQVNVATNHLDFVEPFPGSARILFLLIDGDWRYLYNPSQIVHDSVQRAFLFGETVVGYYEDTTSVIQAIYVYK
jgi:hypothetical protein